MSLGSVDEMRDCTLLRTSIWIGLSLESSRRNLINLISVLHMMDSLILQVAASFLSGLQNAAQGCIDGLPSINGDAASTVITDQYNKCCPVIKAVCLLSRVLAATAQFPYIIGMRLDVWKFESTKLARQADKVPHAGCALWQEVVCDWCNICTYPCVLLAGSRQAVRFACRHWTMPTSWQDSLGWSTTFSSFNHSTASSASARQAPAHEVSDMSHCPSI